MRSMTYSMGVSLDGYIVDPDGGFDWSAPTRRPSASRPTRYENSATTSWDDGSIDEYRARDHPVLVGGGTPFFPPHQRRVHLELLETRTFSSGVVLLRHRVTH